MRITCYYFCSSKWHRHLLGRQFAIETDQMSLRELMNQVVQTSDKHYYLSKLLGYDFMINYNSDNLILFQMPYLDKTIILTLGFITFFQILISYPFFYPKITFYLIYRKYKRK